MKNLFLKFSQILRETQVSEACNIFQKKALTQMFSCKFCEIFKNTFLTENRRATASDSGN